MCLCGRQRHFRMSRRLDACCISILRQSTSAGWDSNASASMRPLQNLECSHITNIQGWDFGHLVTVRNAGRCCQAISVARQAGARAVPSRQPRSPPFGPAPAGRGGGLSQAGQLCITQKAFSPLKLICQRAVTKAIQTSHAPLEHGNQDGISSAYRRAAAYIT